MSGTRPEPGSTPKPNGLEIRAFNPGPSSKFVEETLRAAHAEGALIGRLAVWAWLPHPDSHEYTKDLDIAVSRASLRKIRDWLQSQGLKTRELPIGGVKVHDAEAKINVDFIERSKQGDLSPLFEEAVRAALDVGQTVRVEDGANLTLVPAEYLVAMKIGAGETKDERDARRLLKSVRSLDIEKVRALAAKHLGVAGSIRLEAILRDEHHPAARPGYEDS